MTASPATTVTRVWTACAVLLMAGAAPPAQAQVPVGTSFTYQGRLTDGATPAGGAYDLRFILYDSEVGGAQAGGIVTRDDVAVTSGLFTVTLDFGAVFSGSKRWLEIGVRPGVSTGTYTPLAPRQELAAAPNAVFAGNAATIAGLSCSNGQVAKWSNGWTCGADTTNAGTVTSVATGAGLTGGPITGSGTVAVAANGITSGLIADGAVIRAKIASGAVGAGQIDQTQVQARVATTCGLGEYLRGINADGSVLCGGLPNTITTVDDPVNQVGQYSSVAIGPDGLPVITYFDATAAALKLARCANVSCTSSTLTTVEDTASFLGYFSSVKIAPDGFPVISYYDSSAGALKFAKCSNADCTVAVIRTVDDPADSVGQQSSLAIGSDNLPVISYVDLTAGVLKVAHCATLSCLNASNVITSVDDPANYVGEYTSIAIGSDGLPVISYHDLTAGALKVAKCGNLTCTSGNAITTVDDPADDVGFYTSIAIGSDGLPVISYYDNSAGTLKVAKCGNAACSAGNTITTVDDPANGVGEYTSLAIGADGRPVISYYDATAATLKVAKCGNAACTAGNTLTTVDDPANRVGQHTAIAIGTDGLPFVSYYDETAFALKAVKCGNAACR